MESKFFQSWIFEQELLKVKKEAIIKNFDWKFPRLAVLLKSQKSPAEFAKLSFALFHNFRARARVRFIPVAARAVEQRRSNRVSKPIFNHR